MQMLMQFSRYTKVTECSTAVTVGRSCEPALVWGEEWVGIRAATTNR